LLSAIAAFIVAFIKLSTSYSELCSQLQGRIKALHDDILAAEKRIDALEKENRELCAQNEELKNQILDLQGALDASITERQRLQNEVDELSTRLAKYESRPERNPRTRTVR
jgi:DNA repair exonuclease SbcCD ATPase subunit